MRQSRFVYLTVNMNRLLTLTLLLFLNPTISTRCESFQSVKIKVHPDQGHPYNTTISGCIERVAFQDTIIQAHIKDQKIPKLGRDSIRNMMHLHTATFDNCGINSIDPLAFRNVPNLKYIKIVNGDLAYVPAGVFLMAPKLQMLKFSHNKVKEIEDGAFAEMNSLKKLYCDHNKLTDWRQKWFTNSTNLLIMDFRFNKIKNLPKRAFYELQKLKEIYFDYNELEAIQAEAFKGVIELDYLGLRYNRLKSVDPKVFPNQISIGSLTIDANYLNSLSKKMLETVRVKEMTIDGNPWKCPCLEQIQVWLHKMNATAVRSNNCVGGNVPICSFSVTDSKICTENVDDNVTRIFLEELKRANPPLDKYCARLN